MKEIKMDGNSEAKTFVEEKVEKPITTLTLFVKTKDGETHQWVTAPVFKKDKEDLDYKTLLLYKIQELQSIFELDLKKGWIFFDYDWYPVDQITKIFIKCED